MKITFTDKKLKLPDKVYAYAEKKVNKLDRFFRTDAQANVTFSVEREKNVVELTVRSGSLFFRAEEKTPDMFISIDAAVSTIERQIRRNKTRLEKRLRQNAFEAGDPANFAQEPLENQEFAVVRTKHFPIKPMTVDEAILQMDLLGHNFFAFRNQDTNGAFAVVYVREGGGYGLIEDEES